MSLTLTPPPPSLASPSRYHVAGASPSANARPPSSRPRVSCLATCHAPPSSSSSASIAELEPPRRGERLSLYEVLRVRENASAREIKAAYRALAKAHHPDAARESAAGPGGGSEDFIEIHKAYETLSDPAARAVYDLSLGSRSRRRLAAGFRRTRRWETDQCW